MKNIILTAVVSFIGFSVYAQTLQEQKGIALEMNSGKKPVSGVSINVQGSQPTYTDNAGLFVLNISKTGLGKKIIVREINKPNYVIINKDEIFGRWVVSEENNPYLHRIEMAKQDSLNAWEQQYKMRAEASVKYNYQLKLKKLKKDLDDAQITNIQYAADIKSLEKELEEVNAQLNELAERFAYINFDFALPIINEALKAYRNGEVEKATQLLDNLDIAEGLENSDKNIKLAQELLYKSIEEKRQWIEAAMIKAKISETHFQFDSAYRYYEMAVVADTTNFENTFDFANFLGIQSQYSKSISWFNVALRHSKNDYQRIDCYRWLTWYNEYGLSNYEMAINYCNLGLNLCVSNEDVINALIFTSYIAQIEKDTELLFSSDGMTNKNKYLNNLPTTKTFTSLFTGFLKEIQGNDFDERDKKYYTASIKFEIAKQYIQEQKYFEADSILKESASLFVELENDYPDEYPLQLSLVYNQLGVANYHLQRNSMVEDYYLKSLKYAKLLYDKNQQAYSLDYTNSLGVLAYYYGITGKYELSDEYYLKCTAILSELSEESLTVYGKRLADMYVNMGDFCVDRKNYEKAEELYLSAFSIQKKLFDNDVDLIKYDIANSLYLIGDFYGDKGDYINAEKYYKELLKHLENENITSHPAYKYRKIETLNVLGEVYTAKNEYSLAESLYLQALNELAGFSKDNNQEYLSIQAITNHGLAQVYAHLKNIDKSKAYYTKVLKIRKELAKENPETYLPDLAFTYDNFASFLYEFGLYDNAEINYTEASKIFNELIKTNPKVYKPSLANMLVNIAIIEGDLHRYNKVEALYTEVLEIYKDLAKEDQKYNLELANIYGNISFYQLFNKNFIQAEKSANEGLKIDPTQTWIKTNLAHALLFQGKFNEAQNIYLELKDQTYPEDESKTFRYYFLQDLDEFEKAGITHPDIPGIRELLVH